MDSVATNLLCHQSHQRSSSLDSLAFGQDIQKWLCLRWCRTKCSSNPQQRGENRQNPLKIECNYAIFWEHLIHFSCLGDVPLGNNRNMGSMLDLRQFENSGRETVRKAGHSGKSCATLNMTNSFRGWTEWRSQTNGNTTHVRISVRLRESPGNADGTGGPPCRSRRTSMTKAGEAERQPAMAPKRPINADAKKKPTPASSPLQCRVGSGPIPFLVCATVFSLCQLHTHILTELPEVNHHHSQQWTRQKNPEVQRTKVLRSRVTGSSFPEPEVLKPWLRPENPGTGSTPPGNIPQSSVSSYFHRKGDSPQITTDGG